MDDVLARPKAAGTVLPILDIRGVDKRFAFGTGTVTALSDATLRIGKGEFVCLIGPSGCGSASASPGW